MWYELTFSKAKFLTDLWRRYVLNKILNGGSVVTWRKWVKEEQCSESNDKDYFTGYTICVVRTYENLHPLQFSQQG